MRRTVLAALSATALAAGLGVVSTGTAAALGGETYGCQISPGPVGSYNGNCHNSPQYHAPYSAGFAVLPAPAGATYAWTVPAGYQRAAGLCTSTSSGCRIDNLPNADDWITVSVTVTQGSASETFTARAVITMVCGNVYC